MNRQWLDDEDEDELEFEFDEGEEAAETWDYDREYGS